jgi:hypothetical protein
MDPIVDIATKNCQVRHRLSSRTCKRFNIESMHQIQMEPPHTMVNIHLLEMRRAVKQEAGLLLRRLNPLVPPALLHSKWCRSYLQRRG